ncbi:MAG: response regulator [Bryobacterales bacterium]|nr:response regulator [Bryobacterales bacterium]
MNSDPDWGVSAVTNALFHLASRILVVDDEVHIARFLQFLLSKEGYQTALAHDGLEALDVYKEFQPDGILLDVILPRLCGIDVLRRIHASLDPQTPPPLILLLTGLNRQEIPADIMNLGAVAHCPKPVAPSALIRTLHAHGLYGYSHHKVTGRVSRAHV